MAQKITLADLGWNETFARDFAPYAEQGWKPARLLRDNKIAYGALLIDGDDFDELDVILGGKVYHDAQTDAELPAVGDWVAVELTDDEAVIRARLPRQSCFSRRSAGHSAEEQVIAANVDTVIVVTEAGSDFSLRRMERYFMLISRSGAKAVVVLNKSDLFTDKENKQAAEEIRALNPEAEIHITSVLKNKGMRTLRNYLKRGVTVAFIGSSGVGKSAMINAMLGDEWQDVDEVNEVTGKGRHTTTARELIILPKGGILVDNPGIKEVQMWTDETILRESFADIDELASQCRFHNCQHVKDVGCAIRAAVEAQTLEPARYEGYLQLEDEIAKLKRLQKKRQMTVERRNKRDHKIKARNREDRVDIQRNLKPRACEGADGPEGDES